MVSRWIKQQFLHMLIFARQELIDRYRGKVLGSFWVVLQPLAYLLIFSVVFSGLMKAKLTGFEDKPYAYSIYLISGLLMWTFLSNSLNQLVQVFQIKASIIRKIPISLSIMPLYVPLIESVTYFFSILFFFVFLLVIDYHFDVVLLLIPVLWGLALLMIYGLGLTLAFLEVFLPDIRNSIPIILQLLFWLTPIVYLPSILPDWMQTFMLFNPFVWPIMASQDIILYHQVPDMSLFAFMLSFSVFWLLIARWLQKRLEKDVRDLL